MKKVKKVKKIIKKIIADEKDDVESIHKLRSLGRELLSIMREDVYLYPELKRVMKLTAEIRDIDVFFEHYIARLPKKIFEQLPLEELEVSQNKIRVKKSLKLHAYLKKLNLPKYIKLDESDAKTLKPLLLEVPPFQEKELHAYRHFVKKRLYQEMHAFRVNEKRFSVLEDVKKLLGEINDNFNGLRRVELFGLDEKLFEEIKEFTNEANMKLYESLENRICRYKKKESVKKLYLIRHAKSSWEDDSLDDFERPLSERGLRDALTMGSRLRKKYIVPDIILSSPALRAKTTAELIANKIVYSKEIVFDKNIYEASSLQLQKILRGLDDTNNSAFLFGHNPELNILADYFVDFEENIVTCGIVAIEFRCESWTEITPENAKLSWFDYPKNLG